MPLDQHVNPVPVEPCDQVGDSISALAASEACRSLEACAIRDRHEFLGSRDLGSGVSTGAADALQIPAFIGRKGTQGIVLMSGHGELWERRDGEYLPPAYVHQSVLVITEGQHDAGGPLHLAPDCHRLPVGPAL
jgi:hypothetical protein